MTAPSEPLAERRASWLELFFDLVLVAAVAALAAVLHTDHSLAGLAVYAALFIPVWWVWWGFTWYSAAFNDDDIVNRVAFLAAMAGVGALVAGMHGAAHADSSLFALAYAALFALLAALYARAWLRVPAARALSARYAIGDAVGAALWLASLAVDEGASPVVWAVAMLVLMAAPVLAAASQPTLSYDAAHIAERYGLFTLIVLGESVAATATGLDPHADAGAVFTAVAGLAIAGAVWWMYFDRWRGMPAGGLRSGWVWAQGHLFVFAGIAAAAVGVAIGVEVAGEHHALAASDRLPLCAGLAAYLGAMALIRAATRRTDWVVLLRAGTAALLLVLIAVPIAAAPLLAALVAALMIGEAAVELTAAPAPERRARPLLPHERPRRRVA